MKRALITGVAGQDGSYLVDLLISKGYEIHGIGNPKSNGGQPKYSNFANVNLHTIDIHSLKEVKDVIKTVKPYEIYHLASDVDPRVIAQEERSAFDRNFASGLNILDAALLQPIPPKVYIAGSSLMFGRTDTNVQDEMTPMRPNTPYGIAKAALYNFVSMYREVYGIYCVCGILYNHESPRRSPRFLPKKITQAAARIKLGLDKKLELGDIEIKRDWSHAIDIVNSMWLMMQNSTPRDYVVGSGELKSAKDILNLAFSHVGLDWRDFVVINKKLFRKVEYKSPCADPRLIKKELGWNVSIDFETLIREMVDNDLREESSAH